MTHQTDVFADYSKTKNLSTKLSFAIKSLAAQRCTNQRLTLNTVYFELKSFFFGAKYLMNTK